MAIWGLGCVGLAGVMGCVKAGASRIIAVDINPDKWEIGKALKRKCIVKEFRGLVFLILQTRILSLHFIIESIIISMHK